MRQLKLLQVLALLVGLALVLTACPQEEEPDGEQAETEQDQQEEDGDGDGTGASVEATGLGVYGADGLAQGDLNESVDPGNPNVLDGMKGTTPDPEARPGYGDLLREFTGNQDIDLTFAPQAYDCATLTALAAVAAESFHGGAMAAEMAGLTKGENECEDFEECAQLLEDGETIDYQAYSGLDEWTEWGDPASGTYAVWEWQDGEMATVEGGITLETLEAIEEPDYEQPEVPEDPPAPEETFRLGYVLPETGPLAFLGPPQIESVRMAVEHVNEAGGIRGAQVELLEGDEAGDVGVASESVDTLLGEDVHAITGAAASGMSLGIIDQITGAGVLQCSASNTAPDFTGYPDNGLYWRTAPSDVLQGPLLAEEISADGHSRVAIIPRADDYGVGLADAVAAALEDVGAEVVYNEPYDEEAPTFDADVSAALAEDPDAIVLIAFDEGIEILQELIEQAS